MVHERSFPFLFLIEALTELLKDEVGKGIALSKRSGVGGSKV